MGGGISTAFAIDSLAGYLSIKGMGSDCDSKSCSFLHSIEGSTIALVIDTFDCSAHPTTTHPNGQ